MKNYIVFLNVTRKRKHERKEIFDAIFIYLKQVADGGRYPYTFLSEIHNDPIGNDPIGNDQAYA